jgi:hypothetical protein
VDNRDFSQQYWGEQGSIQARQALFGLPSYLRLLGAESFTLQSEKEVDAVRRAVAFKLSDRYLNVLQAAVDIGHVAAEKEAIKGQMERMRFMHERQMATVTNLHQVEACFQTLNTRQIEVDNAKAVAMEKLRETTGIAVKAVAPVVQERFALMSGQVEDVSVHGLFSRCPVTLELARRIDLIKVVDRQSEGDGFIANSLVTDLTEQGVGTEVEAATAFGDGHDAGAEQVAAFGLAEEAAFPPDDIGP